LQGWLNVDNHPYCNPDKIVDLKKRWPFKSGSVDEILADNVVEHLTDLKHFLVEAARVLKLGGRLKIVVPSYKSATAYAPDHKRYFSVYTFMMLGEKFYLPNVFSVESVRLHTGLTWLNPLLNIWPWFFEEFFPYWGQIESTLVKVGNPPHRKAKPSSK